MTNKLFMAIGFALFIFSVPAQAQNKQMSEESYWDLSLGAQVIQIPKYRGAKDQKIELLPSFDGYVALDERISLFVANFNFGINYNVLPSLNIGLLSNIRFGRKSTDSSDLDGMNDIDDAFETGPFISYQITDHISIDLVGLFDVSDTYKGWIADLTLTGEYPVKRTPVTLSFSGDLIYGSEEYNKTYYGVTVAEANTIRPAFNAEAGLSLITLNFSLSYDLTEHWGVTGDISIEQLLGDIGDSQIVKEETQIIPAFGVYYTF
jgi:outer membrane scaffolding protein for murein synthesis (MipA/OmpV family)